MTITSVRIYFYPSTKARELKARRIAKTSLGEHGQGWRGACGATRFM